METKFTKGSWGVTKTPEYHEPKCSRIEIHSDKQDGWICKVQTDGVIGQDEGFANAKLIAAAPEMFEALIFCKSVIEQSGMFELSERLAFEQAEKALKKATE